MSNDPTDRAGPRGILPLGVGPFPSPAAPQPAREVRMTVAMPAGRRTENTASHGRAERPEEAVQSARRFGMWPRPSRGRIAFARLKLRAGFAVDLAFVIIIIALYAQRCAQVIAPRVPARAVPAVELHHEPALSELRGSIASPTCPSCPSRAFAEPELYQPAPAPRASTETSPAPRPSKSTAPPAKRAQRKGDVVDPWERQ
jgi:hypothetical protein